MKTCIVILTILIGLMILQANAPVNHNPGGTQCHGSAMTTEGC